MKVVITSALRPPARERLQPNTSGLIVDVEGLAVDSLPPGKPVTAVATLITGSDNEPMAGTSAADRVWLIAAESLPVAEGKDIEAIKPLGSKRLLIPAGWTSRVDVLGPSHPKQNEGLRLYLTAPAAGGPPLLRVGSHGADDGEEAAGKAQPAPEQTQTLTLDWPLSEMPGTFGIGVGAGAMLGAGCPTIWRISVSDASGDPESLTAIHALVDDALKAKPAAGPSIWVGAAKSLREANPEMQRGVLTVAALGIGADLSAEIVTLAEAREIGPLANAIADAWDALPPGANSPGAAWAAERATMIWLGGLRAKSSLSKPLASTLSARYGEVGRDPGTVADLAGKSATAADFRRRIIAEHLILLDDLAPGTRVRAYDWLVAAASAPPGFDPLGPSKDRRAALDKYMESLPPESN